ncbi:biotin--[acetyl-CoA-carboxylase] ligase [Maribacter stanieri]|uniref:biotin--[acetyl-CoA-carboxylase] ligase n=1 Tax=Maribacter stanieri TaxID=440514 RepID=UPI002494C9A5|nr:biotin--[acetyl-CoA-carboxylase] ligase [Maribacter stanieri]
MQIIKLDATGSTNTHLKELLQQKELEDFTIVTTQNQTLGRGQLNAKWESEPYKNLAISLLKKDLGVPVNKLFLVSMTISLAIIDCLSNLGVPDLSIKWPNDILSGKSKIGGILIENIISGSQIKRSIIGFGLNVNQTVFKNAPHASSLKLIIGRDFDLDMVFYSLVEKLHEQLNQPMASLEKKLFDQYHSKMFKKGVYCNFKLPNEELISGVIVGVTINGMLMVTLEDNKIHEFGLKEIQLLY